MGEIDSDPEERHGGAPSSSVMMKKKSNYGSKHSKKKKDRTEMFVEDLVSRTNMGANHEFHRCSFVGIILLLLPLLLGPCLQAFYHPG